MLKEQIPQAPPRISCTHGMSPLSRVASCKGGEVPSSSVSACGSYNPPGRTTPQSAPIKGLLAETFQEST